MREKEKVRKKRREALKEVLKKKLHWNPEPPKEPSPNIKTPA